MHQRKWRRVAQDCTHSPCYYRLGAPVTGQNQGNSSIVTRKEEQFSQLLIPDVC
ncbi:unnamed protein product [Coffea canephora]|uniref:Uncharacterized protein n=1 Tax=Coffea canephora TaxID=49390 RepID=A0A068V1U2_COFCA|nr:unnamed protein product [Coffea canephora]